MPQISRSQLALYALAVVAVVLLGMRYLHRQAAAEAPAHVPDKVTQAPPPGVRIEQRRGNATALVHVAGAVRRPGVYRFGHGARVQDAVRRAGGPRPQADLNAINLAGEVSDGQQIVVPSRSGAGGNSGAGAAAGAVTPSAPSTPVNLNTATAEQLDTLEGVGPVTAQKILDWRREHGGFRSVDDLAQVPGIGPKRMAALRDKVQA